MSEPNIRLHSFFLLEQFYKNNEAQKRLKNKNILRTTLSLEWLNLKQIKSQIGKNMVKSQK